MSKINLTRKPTSEQVRVLKDYLNRRQQHDEQGEVKISQLVKKFKNKAWKSDVEKAAHLRKLLHIAERAEKPEPQV